MEINQIIELELLKMELFSESWSYRKEGDLRRFYSKIAISKYIDIFLNGGKPLKIYDDIFEKGIENNEISKADYEKFMKYGKHKIDFLVSLMEDPTNFIKKNSIPAKDYLDSYNFFKKLFSKN